LKREIEKSISIYKILEREKMTVKICWVSRHPPLPVQLKVLGEKLGEYQLIHINRTFRRADEVLSEVKSHNAKYAVVVLPLSMIAELVKDKSITWLWAEMRALHECTMPCPEFNSETDVWLPLRGSSKGRHMRFVRFRRIVKVELVLEDW